MRSLPVALLFLASCRQTMQVNIDGAEAIPSEVAVSKLQELLPTVDFMKCRSPKATIERAELKDWKVDETSIGFHGQGNDQYRFRFADIRRIEFSRIPLGSPPIFELALFMLDADGDSTDMFCFHWADEARARQALELIEALRRK